MLPFQHQTYLDFPCLLSWRSLTRLSHLWFCWQNPEYWKGQDIDQGGWEIGRSGGIKWNKITKFLNKCFTKTFHFSGETNYIWLLFKYFIWNKCDDIKQIGSDINMSQHFFLLLLLVHIFTTNVLQLAENPIKIRKAVQ